MDDGGKDDLQNAEWMKAWKLGNYTPVLQTHKKRYKNASAFNI